ncbi:MAG TPA: hypothetical protein DEF04_01060, partial [Clostridiales bacterium]|nr:hypothetical protein [Clostridiales bacterium]
MSELKTQSNEQDGAKIVFNISDVAKIVGVVPATIRNWENAGLIVLKRNESNYRVFDFNDIEILKKIKEYSSQKNMNISMIKNLLSKDITAFFPEREKYYKEFYHAMLKSYREDGGYTLEEVSKAVGISPSYLSRIENGKAGITFEVLSKLAGFYGESTLRFFDASGYEDRELVRRGEGKELETGLDGVNIQSLIDSRENTFEAVRFVVKPGCGDFKAHSHHSGEEFIYVLSGELMVMLDDSKEFIMKSG